MQNVVKLKPGQRGTKRLSKIYGKKLVCIRYRYDKENKKRYKTVELIIEESYYESKVSKKDNRIVGVRVDRNEYELRQRIKAVGGKWNPDKKVWELPYRQAVILTLESRIIF